MAAKTASKKWYLVASDTGEWHYAPQEAESPDAAIKAVEAEWEDNENTVYYVYELISPNPTVLTVQKVLGELK
jgi:hypothetical protein